MTADKNFCMSSFLAFRYIEAPDKDFFETTRHQNFVPRHLSERTPVRTADDIDREIQKQMETLEGKKLGLFLSGGMDSANLASYMRGAEAYTFRFLGGKYQKEELARAEYYASRYGLNLHYVEISWETVEHFVDACMDEKGAPVHSIEPQLLQGALQAKADGVELAVLGDGADCIFGGLDNLLSEDWTLEAFEKRYTFCDPAAVLENPVSMHYLFERYRKGEYIDFLSFMDEVFSIESSGSYLNAFAAADFPYFAPYASLRMAEPLDLRRVRSGESKYLIRELFAKKYPEIPVPNKVPMPRPVDAYFKNWAGPKRPEFKKDLDMTRFTSNQKWQIWCLERFLNRFDA